MGFVRQAYKDLVAAATPKISPTDAVNHTKNQIRDRAAVRRGEARCA